MELNFLGFNFGLVVVVLLVFAILQWLHIAAGSLVDWVIAVAIFEWLLAIVTVPWNIHFEAKEVLLEAKTSAEKDIQVDFKQVAYVRGVAKWSLAIAITLHLVSAIAFYSLAATGITVIGYISSGAALLLTLLRPVVRGYQYLAARLAAIRKEVKYPREDVLELRSRFDALENKFKAMEEQVAIYHWNWQETRKDIDKLKASQAEQSAANQAEHQRLERQAEQAIAQLTTDGQFLDHVREIIRFFKSA